MSPNMSQIVRLLGAMALLTQAASANAQWSLFGNECCCCPPPPCMQPVVQPAYQTVPVTEYRQVRQTVQRPVMKTAYVEEPITEYHPVTERRVEKVPQVTYQPVTEYIPQTCDRGCWQTAAQCNPRMSPCQYDSRPGLIGWMNRRGYAMRTAMTPPVTYRRYWQPNYVTTMMPVTKQVAQHSVREVAYNVTRMEARQTTRRVAVNRMEYETAEVTVNQPVTVMKTIPVGTSVAWVPFGAPTATALLPSTGPVPDANFSRGADRRYEEGKEFRREGNRDMKAGDPNDKQRTEVVPQRKVSEDTASDSPKNIPAVTRVNGWVARKKVAEPVATTTPKAETKHVVSMADSGR